MSAPAPRWPRFRAPRAPASAALYPRHALLACLVAGLVAGPRWPEATVAAALLLATAALPLRLPVLGACGAAAVLLGGTVAAERLRALDRTLLAAQASFSARGIVVEAPRTRASGSRVAPLRLAAGGPGGGERILVRAPPRVRWPAVRVGDEVVARGRLRALGPRDGFERRRNVHAVLEAERLARTGRTRGSPLDAVRRRAEDALGAGLPAEQAALARGMVLGQDHALPADLREAFRASGLAHLVAASGANVMLLATLVLALATAAGLLLRARLALALCAVALYVPLAGAGPSVQRAGVMGAAGLVAALAGRPATRWYALLLAAAATLAVNPRAVEEPGWQLSFAAVLAILALHGRLRAAVLGGRRGAVAEPAADAAALTLAATVGTAPLLALHFGELSLVSLPANLLAVPAVAPVMWLGTGAGVLGGDAAVLLNGLAAYPLAYLAWLGRAAAGMPHASVPATLPAVLALLVVAAGLGLGARRALRGRPRISAVAGAALLALALVLAPAAPMPPRGFVLSVLDVGQGDAVLLQHGAHAVLVDTGPPGAGVVTELRRAGVRRLDAVLVTHSSADHEGGLADVLAALPVGLVLDGRGPGLEHGGEGGGGRFEGLPAAVPREVPAAGQVVRAGPIGLEILWPPSGARRTGDPNLSATVVLARLGARTALLTADAESDVTLPLDLGPVDVLKVAHHGSQDAGLPALLARVRPRTAVIPVGRNTYGHPAPSTLAALAAVPDVRRTDRDGTVRLALGP